MLSQEPSGAEAGLHCVESGDLVNQEEGRTVHAMGMGRPHCASPGREEEMEFPTKP
jgi:hypothetical protein